MTMSIYDDNNYFTSETELTKHLLTNETIHVPQSPLSKTSKRSLNIKKEISKFNSKITLIKNNKKKGDKADFQKEFAKLDSLNINSSSNLFKKVFDRKTILKHRYNATSVSRSSKNLNKNNMNEFNMDFSPRIKMIREYKIPSALNTISHFSKTAATTIYSVLKKKQNEFVSSLEKNRKEKFLEIPIEKSKEGSKKIVLKNKILINFPDRKVLDERPVLFPIAKINGIEFFSSSEKKRFEKSLQALVNLRYLIENDYKNKDKYVIKFLITNGIIEKEDIETEKIDNFIRFLNEMKTIDKTKSLKENCLQAMENYFKEPLGNTDTNRSESIKNLTQRRGGREKKNLLKETETYNMKHYLTAQQPFLEKNNKLNKNNDEDLYLELENEFKALREEKGNQDLLILNNSVCRNSKQSELLLSKTQEFYSHNLDKIRKKNKLLEFIWKRAKNNHMITIETNKLKNNEHIVI